MLILAALEKSQQVYHPLLKRRSREECIRKRLAIFQEYKAIFNLPAALHQHIKLGEFQQCVCKTEFKMLKIVLLTRF